jgi:hypothetical protein
VDTCNGLERLAKDKHSSLLRKSINYGCKKFCNSGFPGERERLRVDFETDLEKEKLFEK